MAAGGVLWLAAREAMGGRIEGSRLENVERSPHWRDGRSHSRRERVDGLDMATVRALAGRGTRFVVPLGLGAHLQAWGVPVDSILELDWWDAVAVGGLTLTATPSRHFSGRGPTDAYCTLWAGWSIAGPRHRVWYSGDTALDDTMREVGARLGPFDLTMIEVGEYDALWSDVHLGPEQAVRTHRLVRGRAMLPVHPATFDLELHGWTEPIERVLVAAAAGEVRVATPRPGESIEPATLGAPKRWWPTLPWRTARGTGAVGRRGAPDATDARRRSLKGRPRTGHR